MSVENRGDVPAPLARGRDRFRVWREKRSRGTRIPEQLWKLAVKLADVHGLARTASVLRLDYYALKKRVESAPRRGRATSPAFVELAPPLGTELGECVVELEDGAGASMRVHLKGCDAPDLITLSRSFWNGE